jgi:N-acetylneuraminic acid mutarotase
MSNFPLFLLATLCPGVSALVACGASDPAGRAESTGTVGMQLTVPDGSSISSFNYTITGGSTMKSGTLDVSRSNTVSAIIGGLATGPGYVISLTGTSDGGDTCTGSAGPFTVKPNATVSLSLVVACHKPRPSGSVAVTGTVDVCPGIDSISAVPAEVTVGNDIAISVSASPDETALGFPLVYTWTGVTASDTKGNATFHCSTTGSFPVGVAVSNGDVTCNSAADPAANAAITVTCDPAVAPDGGSDAATCSTNLSVPSMPETRYGHAAVLGPDGRIYVIGGAGGTASTEVDAYSPCANTWTTVAPIPTARISPAAALGPDGRIYVAGGQAGSAPLATVEAYDVGQNKWTSVASLLTARAGAGAALGADGRIYVAGGWVGGSLVTPSVEAYNPATNVWSAAASLSQARLYLGLVAGTNGTLYAMGGEDYACNNFAIVEAYDPGAGTWTTVASLPQPQFMANAAALGPNGFIYAFGGEVGSNGCQAGAEGNVFIYDPGKNSWTSGTSMPTPVRAAAAAAGPGSNAFLYVFGGFDGTSSAASVQAYDPVGDRW